MQPRSFQLPDAAFHESRRADGWTAPRQRQFLELVAEGYAVDIACRRVGLSAASVYALRRRANGAAFALGWDAARLIARDRLADALTARALDGLEETITRADGSTVTRHRHDNRLGMAMLTRADRYADTHDATAPGQAARVVAGDFDAYCTLIGEDCGPAHAGVFVGARVVDAPQPELVAVVALANADRHLRGEPGPEEDLDGLCPTPADTDSNPNRRDPTHPDYFAIEPARSPRPFGRADPASPLPFRSAGPVLAPRGPEQPGGLFTRHWVGGGACPRAVHQTTERTDPTLAGNRTCPQIARPLTGPTPTPPLKGRGFVSDTETFGDPPAFPLPFREGDGGGACPRANDHKTGPNLHNSQHPQHSPDDPTPDDPTRSAIWWDVAAADWRTHFPPPDDFTGPQQGRYGDADYARALSDEERAVVESPTPAGFATLRRGWLDRMAQSPPVTAGTSRVARRLARKRRNQQRRAARARHRALDDEDCAVLQKSIAIPFDSQSP